MAAPRPCSASAICRASAGECDAAELCEGSLASCPADASNALDGANCTDPWGWTVGDVCEAGACSGTELGGCAEPITVDGLPYSDSSTTTGRENHLSVYGEGRRAAALMGLGIPTESPLW